MTTRMCQPTRSKLAAFVDGELRGRDLLAVDQHVSSCLVCSDEACRLRRLGDLLRDAAALTSAPTDDLAGLADGVISRVRAEERQSWTASVLRGLEDLHWVAAGVGAVAAAIISAMAVYAVVACGVPTSDASLAALMKAVPPADLRPPALPVDVNLASLINSVSDDSYASMVLAVNEVSDDGATTFVTDVGVRRMRLRPRASYEDVETVVREWSRLRLMQDAPGANRARAWLITSVRVGVL